MIAQHVGLEAPNHFEVVEVGRVDLVQRPVACARQIGGVRGPLHILRARLRERSHRLLRGRLPRRRQNIETTTPKNSAHPQYLRNSVVPCALPRHVLSHLHLTHAVTCYPICLICCSACLTCVFCLSVTSSC